MVAHTHVKFSQLKRNCMDPGTLHCTISYGAAITAELDEKGGTRFREGASALSEKPPKMIGHSDRNIIKTYSRNLAHTFPRGLYASALPPPSLTQSVKP